MKDLSGDGVGKVEKGGKRGMGRFRGVGPGETSNSSRNLVAGTLFFFLCILHCILAYFSM